MLRVYLFFFLMATFGGIGYTAYWYYQNTQAELAQLKENNVLLKGAAETLENTVQTLQDEADANALQIVELQEALQKSEAGLDRLRKRFTEIDITREALEDPADLERRINRGVERLIENILSDTTPSIDTDSVHENAGDGSSN
jgi:chromosome segregation ATPase